MVWTETYRNLIQYRTQQQANDFSLEDLPPGHPIITRENLEEIGEYAFSTLRGLVLLGGQAKIDPNLLLAAAASSSVGNEFMGGGECSIVHCNSTIASTFI